MSSRTKGIGGHQSARSDKDEWITPKDITDCLGPFDLDPCAPVNPPWLIASQNFNILDSGLLKDWHGMVWCNPPYGDKTVLWLKKLSEHGCGIALIFARTETEMFFNEVFRKATSMLFIEGRLYFHHVDGRRAKANSGGPSVLVAYGEKADHRLRQSGIAGAYISGFENLGGRRAGSVTIREDWRDLI